MQPKRWGSLLYITLFFFLPLGVGLAQGDYLLGPEDVVEITVWSHEDLKRTIPISLDGTITFPMTGERLIAAGKTTQQLEKIIAEKLGDGYLKNPQLTVTVKEFRSQKVYVMGEVKNPGTYPVTKQNNLFFVLSQAGGFTKDSGEEVVVIRPQLRDSKGSITLEEAEAKKETIIRVNLKDALAGDRRSNVDIKDGDSIVVPKMPFFYVMGEVQKPGQYNLERGTTVLMGISTGGGLTPKAAPNRTKIVREVQGKKTEIKVGMETVVLPGDTIIVPESYF